MPEHTDQQGENAGILVIAVLCVASSYLRNEEGPAREVPDTIQFWMGADCVWRIRTYAADHDIHIYSMGPFQGEFDNVWQPCVDHIEKHYGDIYTSLQVIAFPDCSNNKDIESRLIRGGLDGALEVAPAGFAFYNPDRAKYRSQSTPVIEQ
jgi:hypothetical protein